MSKEAGGGMQGGGEARLEPYHHGGPHTELKPNPSKVKAEQQQRFRIRHEQLYCLTDAGSSH